MTYFAGALILSINHKISVIFKMIDNLFGLLQPFENDRCDGKRSWKMKDNLSGFTLFYSQFCLHQLSHVHFAKLVLDYFAKHAGCRIQIQKTDSNLLFIFLTYLAMYQHSQLVVHTANQI